MILDVIMLAVLVTPMALGLYRGFVYMAIHTMSWIAALAAGYFLTAPLASALRGSFIGDAISSGVSERIYAAAVPEEMVNRLPDIISGGIKVTAESVSDIFAELFTSMLMSVFSFLLIVFVIKLVLRLVVRPVSKRRRVPVLTGTDKLLGLATGAVEGILLVFISLALLTLIVNCTPPETADTLVKTLDSSYLAGTLYDNNILLLVTGGIFS